MPHNETIHCPWCSKDVMIHKGRLGQHLTAGQQQCLGVGKLADQVRVTNELIENSVIAKRSKERTNA